MNELSNNVLLINSLIFITFNVIFALAFLHLFFNYKLKPAFIKIFDILKRIFKK